MPPTPTPHTPSKHWQPFLPLSLYPLGADGSTEPESSQELPGDTALILVTVSKREIPARTVEWAGAFQNGRFPLTTICPCISKGAIKKEDSTQWLSEQGTNVTWTSGPSYPSLTPPPLLPHHKRHSKFYWRNGMSKQTKKQLIQLNMKKKNQKMDRRPQ